MGRPKKERKEVDKHVRIDEDKKKAIEEEAERLGISFNEALDRELEKAKKYTISDFKGFDYIAHMPNPFTCSECLKKKPKYDPAWYENENGGALCQDCADKHGLTPHVNVSMDRKLRRQKKLSKDYDIVNKEKFETSEGLDHEIENKEILIRNPDKVQEGINLCRRLMEASRGTPEDWRTAMQDFRSWLNENKRLQDLLIDRKLKEREQWAKIMRRKEKKKRQQEKYVM